MDADLKAKWVAALRSGEYKQGHGCLRTSDGRFCCLGVLCRVAGIAIVEDGNSTPFGGYDDIHALGLSSDQTADLYFRNDGFDHHRHTFPEIADYVEANL